MSSRAIFQRQHHEPSVARSVGRCCHRLHIDICQWLSGSSFRGRMHSGVGLSGSGLLLTVRVLADQLSDCEEECTDLSHVGTETLLCSADDRCVTY